MAKRKMRLDVTFTVDMPEEERTAFLSDLPEQLNHYRDSIEVSYVHSAYILDAYRAEPEG